MKQIIDLIFLVERPSPVELVLQLLILGLLSMLILWLAMIFWSRILRKANTKEPIDVSMKLSYMRSLLTYLFCFVIYFFFLIRVNGLHAFYWDRPEFYLAMAPRILIFLVLIAFFVNQYNKLLKLLK